MTSGWKRQLLKAPAIAMLLIVGLSIAAQQDGSTKDITGAAQLIFGRTENPPTRGDAESAARGSATLSLKEKVDDALALGNAARDRNPPDLESAEKAYRLGWKLNPKDPRPYVGLANIYMDGGRYAEAAKAYKEAIRLGAPALAGVRNVLIGTSAKPSYSLARWHAYLGAALLAEQSPLKAEQELSEAIALEPNKPEWRAGLAYCLFQQQRFTEAAAAYARATQLQPTNVQYQLSLKEARLRAEQASAQDSATSKRLEDTIWETHSPDKRKGTCRLLSTQDVRCTLSDYDSQYSKPTWKVQDGLLELIRPATGERLCIGRVGDSEIYLKCFVTEMETAYVWRQQ